MHDTQDQRLTVERFLMTTWNGMSASAFCYLWVIVLFERCQNLKTFKSPLITINHQMYSQLVSFLVYSRVFSKKFSQRGSRYHPHPTHPHYSRKIGPISDKLEIDEPSVLIAFMRSPC